MKRNVLFISLTLVSNLFNLIIQSMVESEFQRFLGVFSPTIGDFHLFNAVAVFNIGELTFFKNPFIHAKLYWLLFTYINIIKNRVLVNPILNEILNHLYYDFS